MTERYTCASREFDIPPPKTFVLDSLKDGAVIAIYVGHDHEANAKIACTLLNALQEHIESACRAIKMEDRK